MAEIAHHAKRVEMAKLHMQSVKIESEEGREMLRAEVDVIKAGQQLDTQAAAQEASAGAQTL
jgi:hypothetical protein